MIYKEKDVRNIIYPNECIILTFNYEFKRDQFIDYVINIITYYGFIELYEVLDYFNKDYNFKAANEYGWGILEIEKAFENQKYNKNEIILTLPRPILLDNIKIPEEI